MPTEYHVYGNKGNGGPIDYTTVVATVVGTSWQSPTIAAGSNWAFGVRAFDSVSGDEDANTSQVVTLQTGANNAQIVTVSPPVILGYNVYGANNCHVGWYFPPLAGPASFLVYVAAGNSIPAGSSPVATVAQSTDNIQDYFAANLPIGPVTIGIATAIGGVASAVQLVNFTTGAAPSPPDGLTIAATAMPASS